MFEVKNRVLSGALDANIGAQTAAVSLLGSLQGLCLFTVTHCFSLIFNKKVDNWFIL